jgi:hypothetical protein
MTGYYSHRTSGAKVRTAEFDERSWCALVALVQRGIARLTLSLVVGRGVKHAIP